MLPSLIKGNTKEGAVTFKALSETVKLINYIAIHQSNAFAG